MLMSDASATPRMRTESNRSRRIKIAGGQVGFDVGEATLQIARVVLPVAPPPTAVAKAAAVAKLPTGQIDPGFQPGIEIVIVAMIAVAARLGVVVGRVVGQRQRGDAAIPEGRIHVSRLRPVDPGLRHRQPQTQCADVHIEPTALYQRGDRQRRLGRLRRRQLTQIDAQALRIW